MKLKPSTAACGALLAGVVLLCYWPALHGGFIFDDNVSLTDNPLIKGADGYWPIWFSRAAIDYWPVTASALRLEWSLWGAHAAGYHAVNGALHLATCSLLWALLQRLRVPGAFLAALIFAVHPLNAEAVAWIAQQKGLLAMVFFLLSIHCWVSGMKQSERWDGRWMVASLGAFAAALLSKGSVVTLPLVLGGIVAWRRAWTARDGLWLAAFAAVALGLATFESQFRTVTPLIGAGPGDWLNRAAGAGVALGFYVSQAIWPHPLRFVYPRWPIDAHEWRWWAPLAGIAAFTAVLWLARRDGGRRYLFAWGYFVAVLLPVLGFIRVGYMRFSPVSDHYAHLALLGGAAFAAAELTRVAPAVWRDGLAAAVVAVLGWLTWQQCRIYGDARTLYLTTLEHNPGCWLAENNLGALDLAAGKPAEAIYRFEAALRLNPLDAGTENNLGLARARTGQLPQAIGCYAAALLKDPGFYQAENNWGAALARLGRLPEAARHFRKAVEINPDYFEGQLNLAHALALAGNAPAAREHYQAAARLDPDNSQLNSPVQPHPRDR